MNSGDTEVMGGGTDPTELIPEKQDVGSGKTEVTPDKGEGAGAEPDSQAGKTEVTPEKSEAEAGKTEVRPRQEVKQDKEGRTPSSTKQFNLIGIDGPYLGKNFRLAPTETRVGRMAAHNDIVLDRDKTVSKRHCTFRGAGARLYVQDVESTKGTFVNKERLRGGPEHEVKAGDEIWIGKTVFRVIEGREWDFSPPKKAGFFYTRLKWPAFILVAAVILGVGIYTIVTSLGEIMTTKSRPSPLVVKQGAWPLEIPGVSAGFPMFAAGDINRDGPIDLVIVTSERDVVAYSRATGTQLWPYPAILEGDPISNPVLADVNGDGVLDVTICARSRSGLRQFVVVYDGSNGMEIAKSPTLGGRVQGAPALADLDGDGVIDIVLSVMGAEQLGISTLWLCKTPGPNAEWIPRTIRSPFISMPVLIDLDDDGTLEILVVRRDGHLLAFTSDFAPSWGIEGVDIATCMRRKLPSGAATSVLEFRAAVAVGDVDGDDACDLAVCTRSNEFSVLAGPDFVQALWSDYARVTRLKPDYYPPPVIVDANRDGKDDVVVVTHNGDVRVYRGEGDDAGNPEILWSWSAELAGNEYPEELAVADFDKNGIPEIVLVTNTGTVHMLCIDETCSSEEIEVMEGLGHRPIIGDLGSRGKLDMMLIDDAGNIYEIQTNAKIPHGFISWVSPQGDSRHLGRPSALPSMKTQNSRILISSIICVITIATVLLGFYRRNKKVHVGISA